MNAYRDPAPRMPDIHVGPRDSCPACGAQNQAYCARCQKSVPLKFGESPGVCDPQAHYREKRTTIERISSPTYCAPQQRLRIGWFRRCAEPGGHLHQRCYECGATWICALVIGATS